MLNKIFKLRGLRGRWLTGGILFVVAIVVIGVLAFSASISSYYYSAAQTGLVAKAQTSADIFTTYVTKTYAEYYQSAYKYAESFEDKDKLELQFVNVLGQIEISSYGGLTAGVSPGTQDIADALATGRLSVWKGRHSATNERIMAVSAPLLYSDGSVIGIMRYVTSLKQVDKVVIGSSAIAAGVGFLILALVLLSNLYFLRTITEPIAQLTGMARRIAEGSYGIQAEKQHDDEIGELIDSINEMSVKLGRAEAMQTEFISSVSHELRTPLTAITGWSETMMYDDNIRGDSRRGVEIISKEASRLTKMVEELLEFTRIQDGRFNLNLIQLDVEAELEDSIFTYGELLRKEGLELVYDPAEEALPLIPGDPERLKQVFLNILDNAAKYGREGKKILVSINLENDFVVIRIRDFGPGIPEAELPHVKEKFYKGSSKERGSGIGLSVCDEIITRMGGVLEITNAPDGEGGVLVETRLPTA